MSSLRDKSGVTAVLVAVALVSLFGMLAVTLDLSRLIVWRNQLQIAADAGALAGATALLHGDTLGARDSAAVYALVNHADTAAMAEDSAINFGIWDASLEAFAARTEPFGSNAIRVTARRSSPNLVAWILGSSTGTARATAIAVFSSAVSETDCVRPFAIARETVDLNDDGVISIPERDQALSTEIVIVPAEDVSDVPNVYYAVAFPPFYDDSEDTYILVSDSAKSDLAYQTNIERCAPDLIGVRDTLLTRPEPTHDPAWAGLNALCGPIVVELCNPSGGFSPDGRPGVPVIVPLWDSSILPIGKLTVGVTELAAFRILGVISTGDRIHLRGRFTLMTDGGTAGPGVGFVERPILVR